MKVNLANISFTIVEPRTPGNIGSISRACKNMGIGSVYLVNPCDYNVPETNKLGWAAQDVLDAMKPVKTLDELLPITQVIIGTTNRHRSKEPPLFTPREIAQKIIPLSQDNHIMFLFGRENNGLTNEELDKCHFFSTIPMNCNYPAINLSQAVMIYAYELFLAAMTDNQAAYQWNLADKAAEEQLYEKMKQAIHVLPIVTRNGEENFVKLFRRVLGRATLEKRDIRLFFKLFDLILRR